MAGQKNNLINRVDISDIEFLQDTYRKRLYADVPLDTDKEKRGVLIRKIGELTDTYYDDDMSVEEKEEKLKTLPKEITKLLDALCAK